MLLDLHGYPITSAESNPYPLYEGASTSARMGDWGLSGAGPNVGLAGLSTIRRRARHFERNTTLVKSALNSYASNMIGVGITPEFRFRDPKKNEEFKELWDDCLSQLDHLGFSDFYGLQEIVARLLVRDGEAIVVIREQEPHPDLYVPIKIQVLESDHLDANYNDFAENGNEIRHSIEFENGVPVAYHLLDDHPGETFLTSSGGQKTRVPVDDVCFVFHATRGGQVRGGSFIAPIVTKINLIDRYEDAELDRKVKHASIGGFVYQDTTHLPPPMPGQKSGVFQGGVQSIEVKPGTFPVLRNGGRIAFTETPDVGNNYEPFMKFNYRMVASSLTGITYEQLSGDLSGVNYTSLRAGRIESDRFCQMLVARTVIFQFCRKFINRWIRTAILTGAVSTVSAKEYLDHPRKYHRVNWNLHKKPFTDPVKDRLAEQMDIRNGLISRREVAASHNRSIEIIDRENAEDLKRAEDIGLRYDCYPSHSNKAGTAQAKAEENVIHKSLEEE
ncbi:MAG: phage portal protein [Desulfotalea sp.]